MTLCQDICENNKENYSYRNNSCRTIYLSHLCKQWLFHCSCTWTFDTFFTIYHNRS